MKKTDCLKDNDRELETVGEGICQPSDEPTRKDRQKRIRGIVENVRQIMQGVGTYNPKYTYIIREFATNWVLQDELLAEIARPGFEFMITVKSREGHERHVVNPLITMFQAQSDLIDRELELLGMAGKKIGETDNNAPSPIVQLMRSRNECEGL